MIQNNFTIRIAALLLLCLTLGYTSKAQIISTYAGTGSSGYSGDGGSAVSADIDGVWGIAADTLGNVYISDQNNSVVRKITPSGIITTVAGNGSGGYSGDGGQATNAQLSTPSGLAIDRAGNLYIADIDNSVVRKVTPSGIISTFAGDNGSGFSYSGDGGPATNAGMFLPFAVAVDNITGNVYIADALNCRIRKVNTSGIISTYAGNGSSGFSGDGGAATAAKIDTVFNVHVDTTGNVYFSGTNSRIRKINTSGIISTIAGTGAIGYSGDGGPATAAQIDYVFGISTDANGNVFFSDGDNNRVRRIDGSGIVNTIAGTGSAGYSGDGGLAASAMLQYPAGLAQDGLGNTFIADAYNYRIRKIANCPAIVANITGASSVCKSSTTTLSDATTGGTWSSSNPSIASVNSGGVVAGVTGGNATITYSITNGCGSSYATHAILVNPYAGAITGIDSICPGDTATLHNLVAGGTWSSSNTTIATISNTGLVKGLVSGLVSIRYIVTSTCGADTVVHAVKVRTRASCTAGVSDEPFVASGFEVYPNPTAGNFTLNLNSLLNEESQVTITNMMGQKVKEFILPTNKPNAIQLNVAKGIYFISAFTNGSLLSTKLIVE